MLQIHLLCVRKLGVSLRTACPSFTETHKTLRQHFSTHSHSTTTGCHVIWLQFGRSNQLFLIHQGCDLHIRSEALHWFGLRTVDLVYNISLTKLLFCCCLYFTHIHRRCDVTTLLTWLLENVCCVAGLRCPNGSFFLPSFSQALYVHQASFPYSWLNVSATKY